MKSKKWKWLDIKKELEYQKFIKIEVLEGKIFQLKKQIVKIKNS